MKVHQIFKHEGFGTAESNTVTNGTEFLFFDKEKAISKVKELELLHISELERKSGWIFTNFSIKEVEVQ